MRLLIVPLAIAALAAALAFGIWLGGGGTPPSPEPSASRFVPAPTADTAITFDDLIRRAQPDAEGNVDLSVTGSELTSAANNALPPDAPVDAVDLEVRTGTDDRPTVGFSTTVSDSDLDVTGAVALDIVEGRVEPELVDARAGPLPLPGPLRDPVEDVVREAAELFVELDERGVDVTHLAVTDGMLVIEGHVPEVSESASATPVAGFR